MGAFYAPTVVAGVHHMYTIIDLGQLSKFGVTYWLPLASAANIAQGGATLAVALKTKDQKIKSMAVPSALSACMGITEPAIFGVNLRFWKTICDGMYWWCIWCTVCICYRTGGYGNWRNRYFWNSSLSE